MGDADRTAYHRPEWIWYLARLVVESRIAGAPEPIILLESILFRAESPEAVYKKAEAWCASSDHGYRNRLGEAVSQRYVGIHDIEHLQTEQPGDELVLHVEVVSGNLRAATHKLVRPKYELSLFGGRRPELSQLD